MVTPAGASWAPRPRVDNAMVKALARAFRWRKMLDTGVHATIDDLARAEGAPSNVSRALKANAARAARLSPAPRVAQALLFLIEALNKTGLDEALGDCLGPGR